MVRLLEHPGGYHPLVQPRKGRVPKKPFLLGEQMAIKEMTGFVFGKLTVISFSHTEKKNAFWVAQCECGNKKVIKGMRLRQGDAKSCGCSMVQSTHRLSTTPIFNIWSMMKQRCRNQNHKHYASYGGRGIDFCDRWSIFENFFSDMGHNPPGLTLDRIDNNLGYSKENCRWVARKDQMRNTRSNHLVMFRGVSMPIMAASELSGIPHTCLYQRSARGLTEETGLFSTSRIKAVIPNPRLAGPSARQGFLDSDL